MSSTGFITTVSFTTASGPADNAPGGYFFDPTQSPTLTSAETTDSIASGNYLVAPSGCTVSALRAATYNTANGDRSTFFTNTTFTLYKNGLATSMACTSFDGLLCVDTTHRTTIRAGDRLSINFLDNFAVQGYTTPPARYTVSLYCQ